jgi:DNA polymerase sigma
MLFNHAFNIFNTANLHMGIQCCNFIIERLRMYPILEPLTLILKKFLAVRNLNQPFQGGLNSYGLIILIIAYLNQNFDENYGQDSMLSKARALKGFLFYYGYQFDQNQFMINSDQQIVLHQSYSSVLIIQDPLNPQNNIGKSTFNFDMIRAEFARAHEAID